VRSTVHKYQVNGLSDLSNKSQLTV